MFPRPVPWPSRRVARALGLAVAAVLIFLAGADFLVGLHGEGRIYSRVEDIPARDAALILGTSKYVAQGRLNKFYTERIQAAFDLFAAGKVRGIVVSGDNSTMSYNEPQKMKEDLVEMGIPSEYVTCDYAGRRTLDSVIRMKEVFGLDRYVIVSQEFHLSRALYLSDAQGHDALGFATGAREGFQLRLREMFARAMAFLDVTLLSRGAYFLGDRVEVPLKPL